MPQATIARPAARAASPAVRRAVDQLRDTASSASGSGSVRVSSWCRNSSWSSSSVAGPTAAAPAAVLAELLEHRGAAGHRPPGRGVDEQQLLLDPQRAHHGRCTTRWPSSVRPPCPARSSRSPPPRCRAAPPGSAARRPARPASSPGRPRRTGRRRTRRARPGRPATPRTPAARPAPATSGSGRAPDHVGPERDVLAGPRAAQRRPGGVADPEVEHPAQQPGDLGVVRASCPVADVPHDELPRPAPLVERRRRVAGERGERGHHPRRPGRGRRRRSPRAARGRRARPGRRRPPARRTDGRDRS